ncbi:MAG: hypothetical protein ABIQ44_02005, partial [Chloroflexia bacterium]
MGKRSQTILTVLVVVLGVAMLASTFAVDLSNAAAVPVWFWVLLGLFAPAATVAAIVKEVESKPTRNETITVVVGATLFLLAMALTPNRSVLKILYTVMTFELLIMGGFRFARSI